jgi:agmatine/peptidylarginine deiminase
MADADVVYESTKKALNNFENIKECIQGLYEILKITLPSENTYFNMGQDNIEALYENFLELMINELGTVEFMKKLKSAEVDLDLPLDNLL